MNYAFIVKDDIIQFCDFIGGAIETCGHHPCWGRCSCCRSFGDGFRKCRWRPGGVAEDWGIRGCGLPVIPVSKCHLPTAGTADPSVSASLNHFNEQNKWLEIGAYWDDLPTGSLVRLIFKWDVLDRNCNEIFFICTEFVMSMLVLFARRYFSQ